MVQVEAGVEDADDHVPDARRELPSLTGVDVAPVFVVVEVPLIGQARIVRQAEGRNVPDQVGLGPRNLVK